MELGGNITLSGFSDLERPELVIVKKIVGSYARKFSEGLIMKNLELTLKSVHKTDKNEKYEIHARLLTNEKSFVSEVTDYNLFFVLDAVLKKIEEQVKK